MPVFSIVIPRPGKISKSFFNILPSYMTIPDESFIKPVIYFLYIREKFNLALN